MLSGWSRGASRGMLSGYPTARANTPGLLSGYPIRAAGGIKLSSSSSGAANGVAFNHTVTDKDGSSLFVVVASSWTGGNILSTATVNGVAGTLLFSQSTTAPSFMRAWYWAAAQLPASGTWSVLVAGGSDAAAISLHLKGVSQGTPVAFASANYAGSLNPSLAIAPPGSAVVAACAVLTSNTVASGGTLNPAILRNVPNALLAVAVGPAASSASFTGTGDARTSIGAAALRAA